MKKLIYLLTIVLTLSGCSVTNKSDDKLNIVTTNFPAYDFARQITGDLAEITLLIPPGAESHSFEPNPKDIINIQAADLFICNGGASEHWIESIASSANVNSMIEMTAYCENLYTDSGYDEHVWCSPVNAISIVEAIYENICLLDPENCDNYTRNRDNFVNELKDLDLTFKNIIENSNNNAIIFADRFPVRYFTDQYELSYLSAFNGCSAEAEPNANDITKLINYVNEKNVKGVFFIEFSNQKIADIICEETGCEKYLFHSCHNISREDFENGETYLSIMKQNAENLRKVIN